MRTSKFTAKDMTMLDETLGTRQQFKQSHAPLKDYSLRHKVEMWWDLNEDAKKDMIFKLRIDDKEVLLDWEELLKAGRFI